MQIGQEESIAVVVEGVEGDDALDFLKKRQAEILSQNNSMIKEDTRSNGRSLSPER
jgi:hypothetical protein